MFPMTSAEMFAGTSTWRLLRNAPFPTKSPAFTFPVTFAYDPVRD